MRHPYNILRIQLCVSSKYHEYLISRHLIWSVLCSLLYDQQGSLKSIKVTLLVAYLSGILFNGVSRTKNLCAMAARACSSY